MAKDEVTPVDDIAHDDQKARGEGISYEADLVLDPKETTVTDFESVDSTVAKNADSGPELPGKQGVLGSFHDCTPRSIDCWFFLHTCIF
ncbi:hypothetical protein EPUS_05728 [Endocarpon pusillum Z07020]|uniref:Uncharacterized protein n=1 Tax=Endocarpon pusillum (strain Z07020 / HMAS-L-300199) TaxID=1263415 RepID=U1FV44_ENDPU|nr:uncharacterized protein EPUS_05728 [Endocarpon pusillum Z07020]ERF68667.1 hypothetical protein EPUS_05728 [Endocarpon pusillum Z07020]